MRRAVLEIEMKQEKRKLLKLGDRYLGPHNTILSILNFLIKVFKKTKINTITFSEIKKLENFVMTL